MNMYARFQTDSAVFMSCCAAAAALVVTLLFPSFLPAANWLHIIERKNGENRYVDLDSIEMTSPGIFHVHRKIEPHDASGTAYQLTSIEINCAKRGIRVLKDTAVSGKGDSKDLAVDSTFHEVNPDDVDETLLELICSLKKSE